MDDREAAGSKRTGSSHPSSAATSRKSSRPGSLPNDAVASPKLLTSFPSFSPPPSAAPRRKRSSKDPKLMNSNISPADPVGPLRSPIGESTTGSSKASTSVPSNRKPSASISGIAWKGATTLHKSLIASLTGKSQGSAQEEVFSELDWDASDPLENATDEQIQRVIDRNGGPIASLRQFSKDLSECNARVAEERNSKLELINRNRTLRDEQEHMRIQLEEVQRKYKNVQNLFKRYVRPEQPGQIQIVDSPNGHYILDSTTGDMIEALKPSSKATTASIKTQSSARSFAVSEAPPKSVKQDAISSLKQLAPRKSSAKDNRKSRESISMPARPDSLELKSPVVLETLPPALRAANGTANSAPVDRLGFFFTASRETRHQEALAFHPKGDSSETSSVNSFPFSDDDQDGSLQTNTSQDDSSSLNAGGGGGGGSSTAEFLSYAPVGPALRFVSTPEHGVRMFVDVSSPSTPTTEVAANADSSATSSTTITQTSVAGMLTTTPTQTMDGTNALDALLDKLNEAFDKQQEKKLNDWNAFHNYLKTNIPKNLNRASSDYGMASIARLTSTGTVSADTLKRFNNLILSGIPVALRREIWMERTGASTLVEPGKFASLLSEADIDDYVRHEISVDVERTMGNNVFFRNGVGKTKLQDILVAYAQFNSTIGYSQGLNIIAGNLLLMVPSAEEAFWLLVAMIDNILPYEYYHHDVGTQNFAICV